MPRTHDWSVRRERKLDVHNAKQDGPSLHRDFRSLDLLIANFVTLQPASIAMRPQVENPGCVTVLPVQGCRVPLVAAAQEFFFCLQFESAVRIYIL
jgi:hypothetical protein